MKETAQAPQPSQVRQNLFVDLKNFIELEITYDTIYPFKVYNSIILVAHSELLSHHHSPVLEIFITHKEA